MSTAGVFMHVTVWRAMSRNESKEAANQQAVVPVLVLRVNLLLMPSAAHMAYVLTQPHYDIWQMSAYCQTKGFSGNKNPFKADKTFL